MRITLLIAVIAVFLLGIGLWSFRITAGQAGADGGVAVWVAGGAAMAASLLIGGFVLLILRSRPRDRDRRKGSDAGWADAGDEPKAASRERR